MAAKVVLYCNGPLPLQGNADQDGAIVLQCKKMVLQCEEKLEGGGGGEAAEAAKRQRRQGIETKESTQFVHILFNHFHFSLGTN